VSRVQVITKFERNRTISGSVIDDLAKQLFASFFSQRGGRLCRQESWGATCIKRGWKIGQSTRYSHFRFVASCWNQSESKYD